MGASLTSCLLYGSNLEPQWKPKGWENSTWIINGAINEDTVTDGKKKIKNLIQSTCSNGNLKPENIKNLSSEFNPRQVELELIQDLFRTSPTYNQDAYIHLFVIQLGRSLGHSMKHVKAFSLHAISWGIIALLVGKLHPLIAIPPFFVGLYAGLMGSGNNAAWIHESNNIKMRSLYPFSVSLNNTIGNMRDIVNANPLGPVAIGAFLTFVATSSRASKTSLWPVSHMVAIGLAAIEGHYLSNEV